MIMVILIKLWMEYYYGFFLKNIYVKEKYMLRNKILLWNYEFKKKVDGFLSWIND